MANNVNIRARRPLAKTGWVVEVLVDGMLRESFDCDTRSEAYRLVDDIVALAHSCGGKDV